MARKIVVKGARVHNLKNIDVEIPRDRLVVITGVSGSGKSSLAFDTLYAEGQRRYLESLAADARQALQQMERPDVDSIEGLSPAVAIEQKTGFGNPRATVGTVTDVYDYLRLLFARAGQWSCPQCGREIKPYTVEQVVDELLGLPENTRAWVFAPLGRQSSDKLGARLQELSRQGFTRVRLNGILSELSEDAGVGGPEPIEAELVIDRVALRPGAERRLADSVQTAFQWGGGIVKVETIADASDRGRELLFGQDTACVYCGASPPQPTPSLLSFNSPEGACPACDGTGFARRQGKRSGSGFGDEPCCPECGGSRLRRESLSLRIEGRNIAEIASWPISQTAEFFTTLRLSGERQAVGGKIISEIRGRLASLEQLGLEYLSLDRSFVSLSGGEAQRVRLASVIGSPLAGVLYILDEPSVGLHQKDNARLLALLRQLRDAGNSVIVVEHDPETISAADYLIDMGPGAGAQGGEVVARGTPAEVMGDGRSVTAAYLSGRARIERHRRGSKSTGALTVSHARAHNLKDIKAEFPLGAISCVTGVSGAGKSTLVMEVLYEGVLQALGKSGTPIYAEIAGWEHVERVIGIDQGPIGRSPRSNPATYTGLYDHLRELFAQLPAARVRGFGPDRFSFNVPGGRCEACRGEGLVRVPMHFLPDMFVTCAVCKGQRYNRETLEIKLKGLSIAGFLDLTVKQALELLSAVAPIYHRLFTLHEVGLGYLKLGQPASTLSGGEAQRVKLARELARKSGGGSLYILDEPTTGLHFADVEKLVELLGRLADMGNTVIVIEHNLDVIRNADHVVDLGPEGGEKGGTVVAEGTPEEIAGTAGSVTGRYLKRAVDIAEHAR